MIATDRRRRWARVVVALAAVGGIGSPLLGQTQAPRQTPAPGQGPPRAAARPATPPSSSPDGRTPVPVRPHAAGQAAAKPAENGTVRLDEIEAPTRRLTAVPVNPNDPVATVNGQVITRRQLADEVMARKGEEILETLINRTIVEQALKARKIEITAEEINREIEISAAKMGLDRKTLLRVLDKDRGISPTQYARDIIYPMLALRKLAGPRVQVTDQDVKDAFEASFGEKLRCRIILLDKLRMAQETWEELKSNPGAFDRLAQERSIDTATRSLGGLMGEPLTRHAYPREVSDKAFEQLVDGNPNDPDHKPKNGDFTGPIQVTESTWVIIKREGVIPRQDRDPDDPQLRQSLHDMVFEAKLKAEMEALFEELGREAKIENLLTGQTNVIDEDDEELTAQPRVDQGVQLMSNPGANLPRPSVPAEAAPRAEGPNTPRPAPVGAPVEDLERIAPRTPQPPQN